MRFDPSQKNREGGIVLKHVLCLPSGESRYKINNMTYLVGVKFEETGQSIRTRFAHLFASEMAGLANLLPDDTMVAEYVHSAAGKED